MQKLLVYLLLFVCCNAAIAQTVHHQTSVYFDKDKAELTLEAQNTLTSTLQSLMDLETYSVKIEAHTDDDGSLTYNQLLSEKRADAVYEFLILQGLTIQDLQIVAKGETNPAFSNQTETGQQQNRRVDVFFVSKSAELQAKKPVQPNIETFEDLMRLTTTNTLQSFPIRSDREQKIEGRKGTKLTIPPNAFVLEDGSELPTNARVEVELQEALNLEDMLLNNLSTKSGEQFLETGGMVMIEANYQGQKLQLKSDKNIEVMVPKNDIAVEKQKDMELFYGVAQEDGEASMDWKPTNEKVKTTPPHPKVEIDWTELEDFKASKFPALTLAEIVPIPKKLASPKKPYRPNLPRKPQKERYRYKPSALEKVVYSRKKIDELSEQKFQEAMTKYEKRKAEYDIKLEEYQKKEKTYATALIKYNKQNEEIKSICYQNIANIQVYRERIGAYNDFLNSLAIINNLKKHIKNKGIRGISPSNIYFLSFQRYNDRPTTFEFDIIELIATTLNLPRSEAKSLWEERRTNENFKFFYPYLSKTRENTDKPDYLKPVNDLLASLDSKYYKKKEEMGLFSNQDFNYFATSISQMGWINIDRWLKEQERQQVFVLAEKDENTRFFAISHKFNSCLSVGQKAVNGMMQISLPVGEEFTIVGMRIEEGKFFSADKSFIVSKKDLKVPLDFQQKTLADLKKRIRDIEGKRTISAPTP